MVRLAALALCAALTGCAHLCRTPEPDTVIVYRDGCTLPRERPRWEGMDWEPVQGCPAGAHCLPRAVAGAWALYVLDMEEWIEEVEARCP